MECWFECKILAGAATLGGLCRAAARGLSGAGKNAPALRCTKQCHTDCCQSDLSRPFYPCLPEDRCHLTHFRKYAAASACCGASSTRPGARCSTCCSSPWPAPCC